MQGACLFVDRKFWQGMSKTHKNITYIELPRFATFGLLQWIL